MDIRIKYLGIKVIHSKVLSSDKDFKTSKFIRFHQFFPLMHNLLMPFFIIEEKMILLKIRLVLLKRLINDILILIRPDVQYNLKTSIVMYQFYITGRFDFRS